MGKNKRYICEYFNKHSFTCGEGKPCEAISRAEYQGSINAPTNCLYSGEPVDWIEITDTGGAKDGKEKG